MSAPRTDTAPLSLARGTAAAVATGLLLAAAFPPLDAGPLALVALVPLMMVWRRARIRDGALAGFVAGVVFFGFLLWWVHFVGYVAYIPLTLFMAAWWALAGAACTALFARGGGVMSVAAMWTLVEAARGAWPFGGFPWGQAGYAWHDVGPVRALAAWGGVDLLTFATAIVAATVAIWIWPHPQVRLTRAGAGALVSALGVIAAVVFAGLAPAGTHASGSLRVDVVQGNDINRRLTVDEVARRLLVQRHLDLAARIHAPVDLIVFPESSLDADPRTDTDLGAVLSGVARAHGAALLVNANADAPHGRLYNTNLLYRPDGTLAGTYVKQHLVPFGEYIPWRGQLRFIHELQQIPYDFAPGHRRVVFRIAGRKVATMICFESAFAPIARADVRSGAEILVVSTNNRSFGRGANAAQHVAMSQLRAAETGRPVVQAAISGVSAFIDARGGAHATTPLFVQRVLARRVRGRHGLTPYDRTGPAPVLGLAVVAAVAGAGGRRRRHRR